MKKAVLALATAATIAVTALAIPSPAEARWRGGVTFNGYAYSPGYDSGYTYYGRYAPPYGYGGSPLITGYVPTILYSSGVRPPPYYGGSTRSYAPGFDARYRLRVRPSHAYGYW
ncbi:hypothetical protein V1283_003459 [Bradyrhizobium sp. AZCC 2262]